MATKGRGHLASLRAATAARTGCRGDPAADVPVRGGVIPKGGNDYRGIGLMEVAWKVLEVILDGCLKGIELHDALKGFRQKRGCGNGILEAKLV